VVLARADAGILPRMRKATKKTSAQRTCPDCGATVPGAILLCDCGYHFQTQRVLEASDEGSPTSSALDGDASGERPDWRGGAPTDEEREREGARRYPWLARGARLFVILAYLSALASAFRMFTLASEHVAIKAPGSGKADQGAFLEFLLALFLVFLAGAVSFVVLRTLSDAARLLLPNSAGMARLLREKE
jgi:hypothetical protein